MVGWTGAKSDQLAANLAPARFAANRSGLAPAFLLCPTVLCPGLYAEAILAIQDSMVWFVCDTGLALQNVGLLKMVYAPLSTMVYASPPILIMPCV